MSYSRRPRKLVAYIFPPKKRKNEYLFYFFPRSITRDNVSGQRGSICGLLVGSVSDECAKELATGIVSSIALENNPSSWSVGYRIHLQTPCVPLCRESIRR
ncbi:hypothetical protein CEXT_286021 [Caerostris extrusa]|uniref:Uncharacterized protein n=1 Tax=Caerostris extrusa TaxID=172846 RepID=A0AAV4QXK8_CAEEX|nr:hypothetical protein CEXT_286021 [Caerostris extrusa]